MAEITQAKALGFKPLYLQVKESLVRRLIDGSWQPGQLIPSEMELAREMGVSQGTVRKALDSMTMENLLIRKQGRGTYVAEPEESRLLFRFFRLVPDSGERSFPRSSVLRCTQAEAERDELRALNLPLRSSVWRFERTRTFGDGPLLVETISLSTTRFPGLGDLDEIPSNLYRLYSHKWGITIGSASEKLKAVAATSRDAKHLNCVVGTPLISISRIAFDLEQSPVELRVTHCLTEKAHYLSELR